MQKKRGTEKAGSGHTAYTVIGVIVALAVIAILIMNSRFFQSRATAVTINGEKYTAADVQFHYTGARQYEGYMAMMGRTSFDPQRSPKDQIYNKADGTTWHDHFLAQAVEGLTQEIAMSTEAEKAGHELSDKGQADIKDTLSSLESNWIASGYADRASYLRATYGPSMTYDKFVEILNRSTLASDFAASHTDSLSYEKSDLEAYYAENQNTVDTFVVTQFLFQATVPMEKDAEGKVIERTEEETAAALEEAKKTAKADAEALKVRLEAGEDPAVLAEEFKDKITFSYLSERRLGGNVNSEYTDWAYDRDRKSGDVTMVDYGDGSATTYNYCVAMFEDRYLDNAPTANIRHILIGAGENSANPTDEEYAQAEKKAQELLDKWKSEGGDEDAFAKLAAENSADTGSAAKGGLMNVSNYDKFVDTFTQWSLDPARKAGDTGIVKNTGSSIKGYHLMYFVGWDDPRWMQTVENILRQKDITDWEDQIFSGYTAETGSGLKYVG